MGRSAILLPLPGANDELTNSILAKGVGELAMKDRLSILNVLRTSDVKTANLQKNATPKEIHEVVTNETTRLREKSIDKTVLVKSVSALENLFASDLDSLLEVTSQEIITLQQSHDAHFLFLAKDSPIRSRILSMSSSYAKLFVKDGTVLMFGVKPHTGIYALQHLEDPYHSCIDSACMTDFQITVHCFTGYSPWWKASNSGTWDDSRSPYDN